MCRCSGHNRTDNSHHHRNRQNHNIGRAVARGLGSVALGIGATVALGIGKLLNGSMSEEQLYEAPLKETPAGEVVTPPGEEKTEAEIFAENKEIVKRILDQKQITVTADQLEEITKKYTTMKEFNSGKISLEDRVVNYANALKYQNTEDSFTDAFLENRTASETIKLTAVEKDPGTKAGFINSAKEQIELFDSKEGDGKIDFTEFLAKEMGDAGIDIEALSDSDFELLQAGTRAAFNLLDINNDSFLDETEIAALTYTTSTYNDGETKTNTSSEISYEEWRDANSAIEDFGNMITLLPTNITTAIKECINTGNLTGIGDKNTDEYQRGLLDIIEQDCKDLLSNEQIKNLKYFILEYFKNTTQFRQS